MPLPDLVANISEIAVVGVPIVAADFPRIRSRRIPANLPADDAYAMDKMANQTVDFAVDATLVLDPVTEAFISAYAWSSDPDVLIVVSCRFTDRGIFANVRGGAENTRYTLNLHGQTQKGRALQWPLLIDVFGTGTSASAPDASWPRDAYLQDARGDTIYPPYEDCAYLPLSVPL